MLKPAWRELGNKVAAYSLFRRGWLAATVRPGAPVTRRLDRAASRDAWSRLFVTEGLAYARAAEAAPAETLPDWALAPWHFGLGLALAVRALPDLARAARRDELDAALAGFTRRALRAAVPGWEEAVLQGLGFAARLVRPRLIDRLDEAFRPLDPSLRGTFWHGVGRGLYFAPDRALPRQGPAARALQEALDRPPDGEARGHTLAGLGWAITLINLRHPEVLQAFLARHADDFPADGDFARGVAAASRLLAPIDQK